MDSQMFEALVQLCTEKGYIDDEAYVYKMILDTYIVVMKKLPTTITNEKRTNVVDAAHAKFRASELEVVFIVNVNDLNDRPNNVINTTSIKCFFPHKGISNWSRRSQCKHSKTNPLEQLDSCHTDPMGC